MNSSDPSVTIVECAYFKMIRGANRLFVILPTSTIDTTESNVAVRNIKLYDWGSGNEEPLMPLTNAWFACKNIPAMTGPTEVPIK